MSQHRPGGCRKRPNVSIRPMGDNHRGDAGEHSDLLVREFAGFVAGLLAGRKGEMTVRALRVMLTKSMVCLSSSKVGPHAERSDNHTWNTAKVPANVSNSSTYKLSSGQ